MNKRILVLLILMSLFFALVGCNTNTTTSNKTAKIEIMSNYWETIAESDQPSHETTFYYDVKEGDVIEVPIMYPIKITIVRITADTIEIKTDVELDVMDGTDYLGSNFSVKMGETLGLITSASDFGAWYKISIQSISD